MTAINLARNAASLVEAPNQLPYTGVKIYAGMDDEGAELYFFAGNESGSVLELENPWATQTMANNILAAISGYAYKPLRADGALLDPAAELGDAITVNKAYTVLAQNNTEYGSLLVSEIAAPSDGELGHEYPYVDNSKRTLERQIRKAAASLTVDINAIKAQVTDDDGNYTVLTLKSDGLYVGGNSTTLDGDLISDGSISAKELANGSVNTDKLANLSITSTKIASDAITTAKIAANAITGAKIAANTITASNIKSGTITADEIASKTITAAEIKSNAITADKIAAGAITTSKLLLTGMVHFYNSTSKTASATLGYGSGHDGSGSTYGAKMQAGSNYIIVTNAGARMTAGSGYIYTASGKCVCSTDWQVGSDINIKQDIDDNMQRYKDVLMRLRPVSFRYKPEWLDSDQRYTGFIAQEAEAVTSECGVGNWAMTSINSEGVHGITYGQVIPVLVACVQDMQMEINALWTRLNS